MRIVISRSVPIDMHGEIRELARVGFRGVADARVEIHVKGSRGRSVSGCAYDGVPTIARVARETRYLVTIGVPRDLPAYPSTMKLSYKRVEPFRFDSWQEEFLWVAAHEASHIDRFRRGGSNGEVRACLRGHRVVEAWRSR